MIDRGVTRTISAALLGTLLATSLAPPARAAVNVNRTGDENPMKEVAKSVIYGGLAGLTIGTAIALATDGSEHDGDAVRWGFASGTFLGLGIGLWWVTKRPQAQALLEATPDGLRAGLPTPELLLDGSARLRVLRVTF